MRNSSIIAIFVLLLACTSSGPEGEVENGGSQGGSDGEPDVTPPTLTLLEPHDETVTEQLFITLRGTASDEGGLAKIHSNGKSALTPALVGATDLSFTLDVRLQKGRNTIVVEAIDAADNRTQAEIVVWGGTKEPVVWPPAATIAPGERQRLVLEGFEAEWSSAPYTLWPIDSIDLPQYFFRTAKPGNYEVEATIASPPRKFTIPITVREQSVQATGVHGIGGQLNATYDWSTIDAAVDAHGTLWVTMPHGKGLARIQAAEEDWTIFSAGEFHQLLAHPAGGIVAAAASSLYRFPAGSDELQEIEVPWTSPISWLSIGADGTIVVLTKGAGVQLWSLPVDGAGEEIELPAGIAAEAVAVTEDGEIIISGLVGGARSLWRRAAERWIDLGQAPRPLEPLHDILVGRQGQLYLAGTSLSILDESGWRVLTEGLPSCRPNPCVVRDLELREDGTLVALVGSGLYSPAENGRMVPVGARIARPGEAEEFQSEMQAIAAGADDSLYLAGRLGVYRLSADETSWAAVGGRGLPPTAEAWHVRFTADGAWILASGGGWPVTHSLYRRDPVTGMWSAFGDPLSDSQAPQIERVVADEAGNHFALAGAAFVYRIDAQSGEAQLLPRLPEHAYQVEAFGVAADGTVFLVPEYNRGWKVYRLAPHAKSWSTETSLPCAVAFERTPDGTLWAAGCFPMRMFRRRPGATEFTPAEEGLPALSSFNDLTVDEHGTLFLASGGTFRRVGEKWERFGLGDPSYFANRISSRGGQTWAVVGQGIFWLDEATGTWLRLTTSLPHATSELAVFEATPQGTLLVSGGDDGIGLLEVRVE